MCTKIVRHKSFSRWVNMLLALCMSMKTFGPQNFIAQNVNLRYKLHRRYCLGKLALNCSRKHCKRSSTRIWVEENTLLVNELTSCRHLQCLICNVIFAEREKLMETPSSVARGWTCRRSFSFIISVVLTSLLLNLRCDIVIMKLWAEKLSLMIEECFQRRFRGDKKTKQPFRVDQLLISFPGFIFASNLNFRPELTETFWKLRPNRKGRNSQLKRWQNKIKAD